MIKAKQENLFVGSVVKKGDKEYSVYKVNKGFVWAGTTAAARVNLMWKMKEKDLTWVKLMEKIKAEKVTYVGLEVDETKKDGVLGESKAITKGSGKKKTTKAGGVKFDTAIQEYTRRKYGLAIGERTSEDIKIQIGSAIFLEDKLSMEVKGRDMITGLPKIIEVTSDDVTTAIQDLLEGILSTVKEVLHKTPPELSADVMDKGITLSGGSSQLRNLDQLIAQATGVPTYLAEDAQQCVARGTGIALENLDSYKRSIFTN